MKPQHSYRQLQQRWFDFLEAIYVHFSDRQHLVGADSDVSKEYLDASHELARITYNHLQFPSQNRHSNFLKVQYHRGELRMLRSWRGMYQKPEYSHSETSMISRFVCSEFCLVLDDRAAVVQTALRLIKSAYPDSAGTAGSVLRAFELFKESPDSILELVLLAEGCVLQCIGPADMSISNIQ
jgi:hypothetical protein